MAEQEFYIGTVGPLTYDDATDDAFKTTGQIEVQGSPTSANHVLRKSDISKTDAWPINSVLGIVGAGLPATLLGFGTWTNLGALTIGTTIVNFWQRTA